MTSKLEPMLPVSIFKLYDLYKHCHQSVSTDTRNIKPGSLFFCLRGANFDGNEFASAALDAGAGYVVADRPDVVCDSRILYVEDALETLQELATFHRRQMSGTRFIGIGGSNGKTTTKELINAVLGTEKKVKATKGNLNNHIGVPLTLLELAGDEDYAIIEMGTNHPGEMEVLCTILQPDWGIVTNIGKEHLEGFETFDAIILEESVLFQHIIKSGGKAFVNLDDPIIRNMARRLQEPVTFGSDSSANVSAFIHESMPFLKFDLKWHQQTLGPFLASIGGDYNMSNILAAVCIGIEAGVSPEKCAEAACKYVPSNNRSQWVKKDGKQILVDCYNANPSSMEAALKSFSQLPGKKAIILGDMFELGDFTQSEHEAVFGLCKKLDFNELIFCGTHFKHITGSYPMAFPSTELAADWLRHHPLNSDYILIKGSRGMKLENLLEIL